MDILYLFLIVIAIASLFTSFVIWLSYKPNPKELREIWEDKSRRKKLLIHPLITGTILMSIVISLILYSYYKSH